jgi:hypothetical protein
MKLLVLLAALTTWATAAAAIEIVLSPPTADAWRVLDFPKIPRHTSYTVVHSDGVDAFRAQADCSASARYLPLDHVDLAQTPRLSWRWKIERPLRPSNERVKAGDDFAARVYVLFQFDPQHASVWEKLRHRLAARRYGDLVPGNVIIYVWSSHEPAGAHWESPYGGASSRLIALGNGALPEWKEQVVNIAGDYTTAFGRTPPRALAIAVMTDTDDTCQQATADYGGFRFLANDPR